MLPLDIFGITNNALLALTAALTGAALVFLALWIAGLVSPRSFNPQKGEPYECGIPTRGKSMSQFRVGYYLFAILFLMFDVETVFLFPWAVRMRELGADGLISIAIFFGVLVLGLAYAWRKGALEWK
jgi:NADH-quinone oxidoreductase subunit A